MRILRKLVYVCCSITLGLMALSSCEGGELYDVNAPDWISEKVDSIADSKKEPEEEVLIGKYAKKSGAAILYLLRTIRPRSVHFTRWTIRRIRNIH